MLNGLVESGEIKARTKWKDVYPNFSTDERYLNMLGNPGSNPIELFWDIVDALDQKLDGKIEIAMGAIKRHNKALEDSAKVSEMQTDEGAEATEGTAQAEGSSVESRPQLFEVGPETTGEDFVAVVKADEDEGVKALTDEDLKEIYDSVCHSRPLRRYSKVTLLFSCTRSL